jgi:hypothetical protein
VRHVGDGAETFFWTGLWLGGNPLCERFGRLFDLVENKSCLVAEMYSFGWEAGGRRGIGRDSCGLWAWEEEMLGEYQVLLLDFSFRLSLHIHGDGNYTPTQVIQFAVPTSF